MLETKRLDWENLACPLCESHKATTLFDGPDRLLRLPGTFRMVKCDSCGLIRQNPRPVWDSLKHFYSNKYDSYAPIIDDETSFLRRLDRRWGMHKLIHAVEQVQNGGRILDVGCGTGIFLAEVKKRGNWEIYGIEPSEYASKYARERLAAPIITGSFPDVELQSGTFDVITMWHVVEHLTDPVSSFDAVYELLKPGGWFIFAIPNPQSLDAKLFGKYWVGWDLPRHLYIFSRSNVKTILESMGFKLSHIRSLATSYFLIKHDLEFWLQGQENFLQIAARILLGFYSLLPIRLALLWPLWILGKLNRAPVMTVFAQKRIK